MKQVMDQFKGSLGDSLIPKRSMQYIYSIAETLPPLSGMGLEYHMNSEEPRVDFLIRVNNLDNERAAILGKNDEDIKISKNISQDGICNPVLNFFKSWGNPSSVLFGAIENVWLEFDILHDADNIPCPSVFFDIDRANDLQCDKKITVLKNVMELLEHPISMDIESLVKKCTSETFPYPHLYYAGAMLPRNTTGIRLCLKGVTCQTILSYLKALNWKGNINFLVHYLLKCNDDYRMLINIDVSKEIHPVIGVEVSFACISGWNSFFSFLVQHNLCLKDEMKKIMAIPSQEIISDLKLRKYLSSKKDRKIDHLDKRLNHVKINFDEQRILAAKTYFYLCYY